jgi:hypothetical protein
MAKKTFTEKQLRLKKYNDIIVKNKKQFKAGQSLTRTQFIKLFQIPVKSTSKSYEEIHKDNLKLVAAQNELNLLMRENGLYLRSSDYYQNFHITDKERTKSQVLRYSSEVDINRACTTRLESNLVNRVRAGTWGTYNKLSDDTIKNLSNHSESKRHKNTRIRVKYI